MDGLIPVIVFWFLIVDIIVVLVWAGIAHSKIKTFLHNSAKARADIRAFERNAHGQPVMHIRYQDTHGVEREVKSIIASSALNDVAQAKRAARPLDIWYRSDAFEDVRVNSFSGLWLLPAILAFNAVSVSIALGVLIYLGHAAPF